MVFRLRFVAAFIWGAAILCAQATNTQARQQDLNYVSTQLPKLAPNFFAQLSPADFNNAASSLQSKLASLTDAEFYTGLGQLVAMAGDAHTFLDFEGAAAAGAGFGSFPLTFRWLDDGIFVTGASGAYSMALGTQLVAVGGAPIGQVVQTLGTVIPHENPQWLHFRVQQYLQGQQIMQGLGVLPQGTSSALTFQDLAGNRFTLQVATGNQPLISAPDASLGNVPLYFTNNGNYWYFYNPGLRLLYFRYAACDNDSNNPFPLFAANLLQTLDSNPVETLVLDFRDNTGGDANLMAPLITGLLQRASTLLANPTFRAYEFINKGTFSSGMDDAMILKSQAVQAGSQTPGSAQWLIVAGEPTGGKPAHYSNVRGFTLPASQLIGQYSTQSTATLPGIPDTASFNPDVAVGMRSTDYFARFDPVIAESLARWSGTTSAPSGNAIVVNGASFRVEQGLAPGSFASVFGAFGQTPDQVLMGRQPGQVLAASSSQVNFLVPASLPPGATTISVLAAGKEEAAGNATITSAGPGLFVLQPADPSQPGAVENQDYSVNSQTNPATAGSILQIFATGYGPLNASGSAPVSVILAGTPGEVLYSGPVPQFPGLWQINTRITTTLTGQLSMYLIAGNAASNAVTFWVH
jgi:uncharacterized protein (TIGR03437 family)